MKILIGILIALLFVTAIFISQQQNEEIPARDEHRAVDRSETKSVSQSTTIQNKGVEQSALQLPKVEEVKREQQLAQTKQELEVLMLKYNDNLKHPAAKKELETEIAALMDKYNVLILPTALEKMKPLNEPQS
ncbi:hypothetical protein [Paraglaciecola sp. MB-3u-78]|uniref:hypothetical protein n=1 Tax=Paraglaciecola sp. MB-3u-78 TaxID=2058332 RepID=UPI000C32351B|nr:hypothetical protein [Paraglaciecola sp. MB-3u-78]PKG95169.1 hypothetical protein CXF95_26110 [Paraglaciecola sp. MB-3u-78]